MKLRLLANICVEQRANQSILLAPRRPYRLNEDVTVVHVHLQAFCGIELIILLVSLFAVLGVYFAS